MADQESARIDAYASHACWLFIRADSWTDITVGRRAQKVNQRRHSPFHLPILATDFFQHTKAADECRRLDDGGGAAQGRRDVRRNGEAAGIPNEASLASHPIEAGHSLVRIARK